MSVAIPKNNSLNDILATGSQNAYVPSIVNITIVHPIGKFSTEGMPEESMITGVVLAAKRCRVLFPNFGNEDTRKGVAEFCGKRPFCSSDNAISAKLADIDWDKSSPVRDAIDMLKMKIADGGLRCPLCPMSKWGSVEFIGRSGKGQVCKEMRKLLIWRGFPIPMTLTLPNSSIRSWDSYCSSLQIAGKPFNSVTTETKLQTKELSGSKYSEALFSYKDDLESEQIDQLMEMVTTADGIEKPLAKAMIDLFLGLAVTEEDYLGEKTENGKDDF
jgi:hypothetical protein